MTLLISLFAITTSCRDNPLDGKKSLNKGSYFYYGLALVEKPSVLKAQANMPDFKERKSMLPAAEKNSLGHYWATAVSSKYMLYLEKLMLLKHQSQND